MPFGAVSYLYESIQSITKLSCDEWECSYAENDQHVTDPEIWKMRY